MLEHVVHRHDMVATDVSPKIHALERSGLDVMASFASPFGHRGVDLHSGERVPAFATDLVEMAAVADAHIEQEPAFVGEVRAIVSSPDACTKRDQDRRDEAVVVVVGVVAGRVELAELVTGRARVNPFGAALRATQEPKES
ncbi:MAG TPA: hypothetical protein VHE30_25425 [Polyangiaceae bacterium]|nr:hypothetical protein [Polyangiaceae bacterium]